MRRRRRRRRNSERIKPWRGLQGTMLFIRDRPPCLHLSRHITETCQWHWYTHSGMEQCLPVWQQPFWRDRVMSAGLRYWRLSFIPLK